MTGLTFMGLLYGTGLVCLLLLWWPDSPTEEEPPSEADLFADIEWRWPA